jgi:hypothetical protein
MKARIARAVLGSAMVAAVLSALAPAAQARLAANHNETVVRAA